MNQDIKIIPLTLNNCHQWQSLVIKAATLWDVEQHLQENAQLQEQPTAAQIKARKKAQTRASTLIEQSLSRDVATLLGTDCQSMTPHDLMQKI